VRGIVAQLAQGLQALHGKEMLHQDLRPENVMIDRAGTVKIIDLATTHVAGWPTGRGRAGRLAIAGTLQYTAPEYFVGTAAARAPTCSRWPSSSTRCSRGSCPMGCRCRGYVLVPTSSRLRYVPVRHFRPDLPAWVDAVLQKALNPNPAKRQQAVSELAHDLKAPGREFLASAADPADRAAPGAVLAGHHGVAGRGVDGAAGVAGARALM
jgi:serine/threonine protein kinase